MKGVASPGPAPLRSALKSKWAPRLALVLIVLGLHLATRPFFGAGKEAFHGPSEQAKVGTVEWWPCPDKPSVDCGTIVVPKDYFNASAGIATVALARTKATKYPKRGSIMLNPGGPGIPGTVLGLMGDLVAELVGHDWDLVGFDPRGIGRTTPKVQCFASNLDHHLFLSNTVLEQGITFPSSSNVSTPQTYRMLVEQHRQLLALQEAQAQICTRNMDVEELRYMGTATVVRDMDFITRVLEGQEAKVNYWGGSYGSILGAYLVNMMPNRIGYVSIDGIANPVSWSNEPSHKWHKGWVSSTELTYDMFLRSCSDAGPRACPLANETGEPCEKIKERIESFIESLVDTPLAVPDGARPGYLSSGAVRGLFYMALQGPRTWPAFSHALARAMEGSGGALLDEMLVPLDQPAGHSGGVDLVRFAVTCLDSPVPNPPPSAEDLADEAVRALRASPHFGVSVLATDPDGGCQFWPVRGLGPERFTGPFNATLERPMLIISNTGDPITPITSGLLVNSLMPNSSTLVIQNGPGHMSTSLISMCTVKLTREYWSGHVPTNGTVCEVERSAFPDPESSSDLGLLSSDDLKTLKLVDELGDAMMGIWQPRFA